MAENPFAAAPFAAAMTQMQAQAKKAAEDFGQMFKTMPSMSMPGMPTMPAMPGAPDFSGWMASYQRNLEALAAANRIAMEGAQAVGRRQLEIIQETIAELTDTMTALGSITTPEAAKAAVNPEV